MISVPLFDSLPGMSGLLPSWMLLEWKWFGIIALSITLTIIVILRNTKKGASSRMLIWRVLIGQFFLGVIVALCCEITVPVSEGIKRPQYIRLTGVWGWVFGLLLSSFCTTLFLLGRKYFRNRFQIGQVLRVVQMLFGMFFILAIVNRIFVIGPRILTDTKFTFSTMRNHPDVYRGNVSTFLILRDDPTNQQMRDIFVYHNPNRSSELLTTIPSGTLYYGDTGYLSYPTTHRGWRYIDSVGGYSSTFSLLSAFHKSSEACRSLDSLGRVWSERIVKKAYLLFQDRIAVFAMDIVCFQQGVCVSSDLGWFMSPLSLISWLLGLILSSVMIISRER